MLPFFCVRKWGEIMFYLKNFAPAEWFLEKYGNGKVDANERRKRKKKASWTCDPS